MATMKLHASILLQRSEFFDGVLLGAGTAMAEGQGNTVTVELEDEEGQFGKVQLTILTDLFDQSIDLWID